MLMAFFSCLPTVTVASEEQLFPNITFKLFSEFVSQNFSSQVSLTTVLVVLFSLTENSDLLNLHGRQKNPYILGEKKSIASSWIKSLARALNEHLGKFSQNMNEEDNALIIPIATKLDTMASVLQLELIFSKKGKLKKKLATISHRDIAAVHVICPSSMEHSILRYSKSYLNKGAIIHNNVHVLSGKCKSCDAGYYADHELMIQTSGQRNRIYLNSAKYMKIGQHIWADCSFSNAVVNGMYSFHASAAAYTDYWNNTFGQINLKYSAKLTFVQETVQIMTSDQKVYLELHENLPIDEVTKEAYNALGQNGIIYAANGHSCSECSQPYMQPENASSDNMNVDHADVKMCVIDGIVMGPTHCAYQNCESDLLNACGGSFCPIHEREYENKCCLAAKIIEFLQHKLVSSIKENGIKILKTAVLSGFQIYNKILHLMMDLCCLIDKTNIILVLINLLC
ncbi:LOW QUALITY PROTEIN: hypothetical protein CVT25_009044 [Psilocybe cyanescens]|uniref:CBM1 domain-containing protein n=1 Tax=Psilocybe cyanescens TaxID=93625 RepID=A0A409XQD5_PSICY|nr:LOW QUALITY PROTEIN: hypothetical protein CVT25_009044 [Psilocybe cyanescens]